MITLSDDFPRMIRRQVQLTGDRCAIERAAHHGVSTAETIRRCIDRGLADEPGGRGLAYDRARTLVGAFEDRLGASDVSACHDRYLTESD